MIKKASPMGEVGGNYSVNEMDPQFLKLQVPNVLRVYTYFHKSNCQTIADQIRTVGLLFFVKDAENNYVLLPNNFNIIIKGQTSNDTILILSCATSMCFDFIGI